MTIPFVVILGLIIYLAVRYGNVKPGGIVLGVTFGLVVASTAAGPPLSAALNKVAHSVVAVATQSTES